MNTLILEAGIGGLNPRSVGSLLLIGVAPLALTTFAVYRFSDGTLHRGILLLATLLCVVILVGGLWQMAAPRIGVRGDSLEVGGGLYRVTVPLDELDLDCALIIDRDGFERSLSQRNNGIELPGLSLGWFQTKEGRVFAAIGTAQEIVFLPTRLGYSLATTPDQPKEFLSRICDAMVGEAGERRQPCARGRSCATPDQRM